MDLVAIKDGEEAIIEIKSFVSGSFVTDFHAARGQYLNYLEVLSIKNDLRPLYLAVPIGIYQKHFNRSIVKAILAKDGMKMLVFNPQTFRLKWIN